MAAGRCFVAGGTGFIGRHVVAALLRDGWSVTGSARDVAQARRLMPDADWVEVDFNRDTDAAGWSGRLAGFDAVVNCVGILQSALRNDSRRVHVDATVAMMAGAASAGVRSVVQISALGADAAGTTPFARDKAEADAAIARVAPNAFILRPSLVYARDTYGGTRLMRALAGLPGIAPVIDADIAFEPIHADDLARIVVRCLDPDARGRGVYEIGGPQTLSMQAIVAETRWWLGFGAAREVRVPMWLLRPALWLGDGLGWLGAASAWRSTTLTQALAMPRASSHRLIALTGIEPRPMRQALAAEPAGAADRLAARLGFALPALRIALGFFWIISGIVALLPAPFAAARAVAELGGVPAGWSAVAVATMAIVDVALGLPLVIGVKVRLFALLQAAVCLGYIVGLGVLLPALFADPLGAVVKIVPILFAALVVAAAAEDR